MRKLARTVLLLSLAAALAAPAMAQDKKKGKKKGKKARGPAVVVVRLPKAVRDTLTDDQKPKLTAINKEYAPKLIEIRKKQAAVLTADQTAVLQKVRKSGLKGQELRKALADAQKSIQLTSDQKKQRADLAKQERTLRAEVNKKVLSVLTDDQKQLLKKSGKKKGKKKAA